MVASGLVTAAVGWLAIVVLQIEREATVIAGQPGGVIVGALAGALLGALLAGTTGEAQGRRGDRSRRDLAQPARCGRFAVRVSGVSEPEP